MNTVWESRFGSLISAAGSIWLVAEATSYFSYFTIIILRPGPLELCCLGIVTWLHAKYRATLAEGSSEHATQE